MNSSGDPPPKRPEIEIGDDGSTMSRFMNLTRRLLGVSREEVREKEKEFKMTRKAKKKSNHTC